MCSPSTYILFYFKKIDLKRDLANSLLSEKEENSKRAVKNVNREIDKSKGDERKRLR